MARETIMYVALDEVAVAEDRRAVDMDAVKKLAASIKEIGLQHPITVRSKGGNFALVAGRHRLEACRLLGEERVQASIVKMDDVDAEMWEISENLHRAELKALDRDEQVARWIGLSESRKLSSQSEKKLGRPEGGVDAARRELGLERNDAHRATKVAGLSDDAKQAARDAGLDDNRSALLAAAKEPHERQAAVIRDISDRKSAPSKIDQDVRWDAAKQFAESLAGKYESAEWDFVKASLYSAGAKVLGDAFCNHIGACSPIMDRRYA